MAAFTTKERREEGYVAEQGEFFYLVTRGIRSKMLGHYTLRLEIGNHHFWKALLATKPSLSLNIYINILSLFGDHGATRQRKRLSTLQARDRDATNEEGAGEQESEVRQGDGWSQVHSNRHGE